jgi:molecular chaperone GrpE (heat shock protein)
MLKPLIEARKKRIEELKLELQQMDDRYEKEQEDNKNLERRIEEKEKKTEEYTLAIREAEA